MRLNSIKPGRNAKAAGKRPGRGHAAGQGKTSGRGVKGQHARSGGYHKVGFEGGQNPLQRRLPKIGFLSRKAIRTAEVRLNELARFADQEVTLDVLKKASVVPQGTLKAKVILAGELNVAVKLSGIAATAGAAKAIEAAGGSVA
ncbi:MAG: 50S ribosomal protein L15 [Gammaproteobacteria bacterium]|jgi:large subunit ribosomal protein L15